MNYTSKNKSVKVQLRIRKVSDRILSQTFIKKSKQDGKRIYLEMDKSFNIQQNIYNIDNIEQLFYHSMPRYSYIINPIYYPFS